MQVRVKDIFKEQAVAFDSTELSYVLSIRDDPNVNILENIDSQAFYRNDLDTRTKISTHPKLTQLEVLCIKNAVWWTQNNVTLSRKYLRCPDFPLFLHPFLQTV